MDAAAYIVHRMPGRFRIRVPSKKGDSVYFSAVRDALSSLDGVEGVTVSPSTGSILVHGRVSQEDVIEQARSQGLFVLKEGPATETTTFHDAVAGQFSGLNERVKNFTGASFDLPALAFVGLVGAGIYQIARGNFTGPAWYTAFWYALGIFGKSSSGKSSKEGDKGPVE